jgi:hypothetical protein
MVKEDRFGLTDFCPLGLGPNMAHTTQLLILPLLKSLMLWSLQILYIKLYFLKRISHQKFISCDS